MTVIHKPVIHIEELGEQGRLPPGGIINAGGVEGPTFTVDGKALIFSDGTATDGSGPVISILGGVQGYEHIQAVADQNWIITHNKGSRRVQITLWDSIDEVILADVIKIIDTNTVLVHLNTASTGRAILMTF